MILKIVIPFLVVLGALNDGFYDNKKKGLSSVFKSAFIACICLFLALPAGLWHVVYLLLCWWVLFDPVYNKVRGLGLFYVGNTKWTDKLLWKISFGNASHASFITKLMAIAGIIAIFYNGL
jgi:hypothetical protein